MTFSEEERRDDLEMNEDLEVDTDDTAADAGVDDDETSDSEEVDYKDQLLRLQAEFANYKKRLEEERLDTMKYMSGKSVEAVLPGVDNLRLAMNHVPDGTDSNWIIGMNASLKSIDDGLAELGVKRMDLVGKPFDADKAEALGTEPGEKDVVVRVASEGYMIHDKILRLAKVMVGSGEAADSDETVEE